LLSLSAQKFISDLSKDAYHFAKLRSNGTAAGRGRPSAGTDRNKVILTIDDLSLALGEHGVNAKKPDYCELVLLLSVDMTSLMHQTCSTRRSHSRDTGSLMLSERCMYHARS
jgi:hypothetical protein